MRAFALTLAPLFAAADATSGASATDTTPAPVAATTDAAKPAKLTKPRKPSAAKQAAPAPAPTTPADAEPAVRIIGTARTAATIANAAASFGGVLSDRDQAYIRFYASFAGAKRTGRVTLTELANSGRKPNYAGSNKPHDAGIVTRLSKAGILNVDADGSAFTFTPHALTLKIVTDATA